MDTANVIATETLSRRLSLSQVWAAVAILLPVMVVTATPLVAIDLAYQIRAGELMLRAGALLRADGFTATAAGLPWTDQQWLAQILFALAFRAGGWLGLAVLRGALSALVLFLVFASCRIRGASRRGAAFLTLATGVLLPPGFQLRPQLFGMAAFAGVVLVLARREAHPRGLAAIPIVTAVWANLHGSFVLAPVLVGIAWLEESRQRGPLTRSLGALVPVTALATLANPFGPRVWSYAIGLSSSPLIRRVVDEWQPPTIRNYAGVVFFLSVAAVAFLLSRVSGQVPLATYATLAVFFVAGLVATRGIYWWAMAVPVAVAPILARALRHKADRDPVNPLNAALVGLLAVGVGVALFPWASHADQSHPGERLLAFAPKALTDELDAVLVPGMVIYNAQEWGSWLELRFPENPVTTDSRFEIVPESVWRDNERVAAGVEGWQAILDRWNVDVAVLARDQQSALIDLIGGDPGWRVVYEDDEGVIALRS